MLKGRLYLGVMSLLLPGLGQLFCRSYVRGVLFFAIFILFLLTPGMRGYILWVVFFSALDVVMIGRPEFIDAASGRIFLFGGLLAFLGWISIVGISMTPLLHQLTLDNRIDGVVKRIRTFKKRTLIIPQSLELIGVVIRDPWGHSFRYYSSTEGFEIISNGPDGAENTGDDISSRHSW